MLKFWLDPHTTFTAPAGCIDPPGPADAEIVYTMLAKAAVIVWLACTFVNVYDDTAPTLEPSTSTSAIVWQASGVMVNAALLPQAADTAPDGAIAPPVPADAEIVYGPFPATVA